MAASPAFSFHLPSFFRLRRRLESLCPECRVCGRQRDSSAEVLLSQGHRRAAIWAARTKFEQSLTAVVLEICRTTKLPAPKTRQRHVAIQFLADHGYIEQSMSNRMQKVYSRASEVVHGELPSKYQVSSITRDLLSVIETLACIEPVADSAAVEGGEA